MGSAFSLVNIFDGGGGAPVSTRDSPIGEMAADQALIRPAGRASMRKRGRTRKYLKKANTATLRFAKTVGRTIHSYVDPATGVLENRAAASSEPTSEPGSCLTYGTGAISKENQKWQNVQDRRDYCGPALLVPDPFESEANTAQSSMTRKQQKRKRGSVNALFGSRSQSEIVSQPVDEAECSSSQQDNRALHHLKPPTGVASTPDFGANAGHNGGLAAEPLVTLAATREV